MNTLVTPKQQRMSPSILRMSITLAFLTFILIGANDGAFGVLLPNLQQQYHVDKAVISLLFLCGTLGYFIASLNNGFLMTTLGNQRTLMLGTFLFICGVGILILVPPFALILLAFCFIGCGAATLDAGLNSYVVQLPNSTVQLNYLHFFYGIGALLGPIIASAILAIHWHWNITYMLWSAYSLLILLGLGLFFRERTKTSTISQQNEEATAQDHRLSVTLKRRVVWIAAFFLLTYVGTEVSIGNWSYSFLTEQRQSVPLLAGWIVSGYWLGLSLGRLFMGHVGARIGNQRLIQLCLAGVVVGLLLLWLVPVQIVGAFGLCLTGFSLGPIFPTTIALMPSFVSRRMVPTAIGFLASLGSMGAAFFPWLAGNLAQYLGLWSLLPYVIVLTIVMSGLWFLLQRQPTADQGNMAGE